MKKNILLVLITAIICITGTATAAYIYTARDIGYVPIDNDWNVSNASEALNSLKTDITNMQNLANKGDMLYPSGSINLVANASDNSYYVNSNGNYVIAESEEGQLLLKNSNYKSVPSNFETTGEVGSNNVEKINTSSDLNPVLLGTLENTTNKDTYTMTLSDTISNYSMLIILGDTNYNSGFHFGVENGLVEMANNSTVPSNGMAIISTSYLKNLTENKKIMAAGTFGYGSAAIFINYKDDTHIDFYHDNNYVALNMIYVYGVK